MRAAVFRAPLLAVLRAGFLAAVLRAGFLALDFRVVLRALVFFALAPRRALLAVVFLLLVVRFFPLVLVAMACAPILLLLPPRPLKLTRTRTNHAFTGPGLPSHIGSQLFFSL